MVSLMNSRLKLVFYVHFVLVVLATIGHWSPLSYLFYNLVLTITLLWSLFDNNAAEPVQHAILINGAAIVFDIILLALRFPQDGAGNRFSAAMAILNLVVRPFSTIILHRILEERNGSMGALEGVSNIFSGPQSNYQDIDKNQAVPTTSSQQDNDPFI